MIKNLKSFAFLTTSILILMWTLLSRWNQSQLLYIKFFVWMTLILFLFLFPPNWFPRHDTAVKKKLLQKKNNKIMLCGFFFCLTKIKYYLLIKKKLEMVFCTLQVFYIFYSTCTFKWILSWRKNRKHFKRKE